MSLSVLIFSLVSNFLRGRALYQFFAGCNGFSWDSEFTKSSELTRHSTITPTHTERVFLILTSSRKTPTLTD